MGRKKGKDSTLISAFADFLLKRKGLKMKPFSRAMGWPEDRARSIVCSRKKGPDLLASFIEMVRELAPDEADAIFEICKIEPQTSEQMSFDGIKIIEQAPDVQIVGRADDPIAKQIQEAQKIFELHGTMLKTQFEMIDNINNRLNQMVDCFQAMKF